MGDELRVARGTRLQVAAAAQLNPDIDALDRLELVVLGDVNAQEPARGQDRIQLKKELVADRSMWVAVRAIGRHQEAQFNTIAHSAPIYVVVDDQPTWKADAAEQPGRLPSRAAAGHADGAGGSAAGSRDVGNEGDAGRAVAAPAAGAEAAGSVPTGSISSCSTGFVWYRRRIGEEREPEAAPVGAAAY